MKTAPLPVFQTQAIDAIIKRLQYNDIASNHSNVGPDPSIASSDNMPSWMMPMNKVAGAQSTIMPNATLSKTYTPTCASHSRSKSVPYNFLSTIDDVNNSAAPINDQLFNSVDKPGHRRLANHSSHVSMDADSLQKMIDTGQSLLLTQSFRPNFDDDDDQQTETTGNNEEINSSSTKAKISNNYNPYLIATQMATTSNTNPFETDDSSSSTPTQTSTVLPQATTSFYDQTRNTECMNSKSILPPPVPPQSTKPAYPKYARRSLF